MRPSLALVMIVKNEEAVIGRCLNSVAPFVDEIIIVDTGSTDETLNILKNYKTKVYHLNWGNDFSTARNFALDHSSCEWNLVLDADEYITDWDPIAIQLLMKNNSKIGKIEILNEFLAEDGLNYERVWISRIFPSKCRYEGRIHEQVFSDFPRSNVPIRVMHDGYKEKEKFNRNLPILLEIIQTDPFNPYYHYQISKEYKGLKEFNKALDHLQTAYENINEDASYAPNLIVDYLYAMIETGSLEAGVSVIEQSQDRLSFYSDFHFVCGLFLLELVMNNTAKYGHLVSQIPKCYLRAIEIGENSMKESILGTGSFAAQHNLGVFFEVTGEQELAKKYYLKAAEHNYEPSLKRLREI